MNTYRNGSNYEDDYIWGSGQEALLYPLLKQHYHDEELVHHCDNRNAKFDMTSHRKKRNTEIKSRKCKTYTYSTMEISLDKCIELDGYETDLVFNCIDAVIKIKYNAELFKTFERKFKARDNKKGAEKWHIYIPVKLCRVIIRGHRKSEDVCMIKLE